MKKLLAVVALLMLVSPVLANPTVTIGTLDGQTNANPNTFYQDNYNGAEGLLTVAVTFDSTNGYDDSGYPYMSVVGLLTLSGWGASNFTPDNSNIAGANYSGLSGLAPNGSPTFIWQNGSKPTAANRWSDTANADGYDYSAPDGLAPALTFFMDDNGYPYKTFRTLSSMTPGMVMMIFQFDYYGPFWWASGSGLYADLETVSDPNPLDTNGTYIAALQDTQGNVVNLDVTNNDISLIPYIPEPATLGLLGLGLFGLVIRRKKA